MSSDYIFSDGTESVRFATQREAIYALCEWLLRDPSQQPAGTVLSITHGDEVILRFRIPLTG